MQSLKSNALEPTRAELAGLTPWRVAIRILPVYGLPILAVALAVLFSILLPESFPTALNIRSILSDKGIIALLSLGAMLPMMAGRIDLTIGFGIVMWHILAITLQVWYHILRRTNQRPAGRGRPDRQLHRHAGHRHDPLRARAVA
jgi:ribose transport system permease protein